MNKSEINYKAQKGKNVPQTAGWRWTLASIFYIPALGFVFFAMFLLRIANFFLFDTHHFEFKVTPKK